MLNKKNAFKLWNMQIMHILKLHTRQGNFNIKAVAKLH